MESNIPAGYEAITVFWLTLQFISLSIAILEKNIYFPGLY